jgi:integrase
MTEVASVTALQPRTPAPPIAAVLASSGVELGEAVGTFLGTIAVPNTRRGYAGALDRMVRDLGADTPLTELDPDQVAEWFTGAWGTSAAKTFNTRLTALSSACSYWRTQGWLPDGAAAGAGGRLTSRLRTRPAPADRSKAMTRDQVAAVLALEVPLRERVLWSLLYESTARADEVLLLDVNDLDTANRQAKVVRKGGARDTIGWQTGTARLLPRLLAGRRTGPVFLTSRRARPSVALVDIDQATGRARLSYRRAAELFETHTAAIAGGPFTLHQLRHSGLTHAAEDGASTPMLMALSGHTSVRSLVKYTKISAEALGAWRAEQDPASRRRSR